MKKDAYLYILSDKSIEEYHGQVDIGLSRAYFHEDYGKELPHYGKVAKEEGMACLCSMWFRDRKTKQFVIDSFIKNYNQQLKYAEKRVKNLNDELSVLKEMKNE